MRIIDALLMQFHRQFTQLIEKSNPQRPTHYEKPISELNMKGIEYPVSLDNIKKFEKQNPKYGINVFILDKNDEIVPRIVCKENDRQIINLLLITDNEKQHYVWIKIFLD